MRRENSLDNARIMIVEDEAILAMSLEESLQNKGYEVVNTSMTGEEALEVFEQVNPDLIIMDIALGGKMNGVETFKMIAARKDVPVIFLTSSLHDHYMKEAAQTGAFAYLIKPYNEKQLLANVEIALLKHRASRALNELNDTKDKFFSIIAHDLRSPLAGLVMTTNILKERASGLSKEDLDYFLTDIHSTSDSILELTTNLFEWSKIQTKRITVNHEAFRLSLATDPVLLKLRTSLLMKKLDLQIAGPREVEVYCDLQLLCMVIANILSNAIKFSGEKKSISMEISITGNFVKLLIVDKGAGISQSALSDIFEGRYRKAGTTEEKGAGLGLIVSKSLMELMGGKLSIKSVSGVGTEVEIYIPRTA